MIEGEYASKKKRVKVVRNKKQDYCQNGLPLVSYHI